MKTDTLFYQFFKDFPRFFFELIGKPDTNTSAYEFMALEIKQQGFRLDGLFATKPDFPQEPPAKARIKKPSLCVTAHVTYGVVEPTPYLVQAYSAP